MARIVQLFKNLKYISKKDLRKNHLIEFSAEELLVNMLYYVPNSSVVRPNVLDGAQTIDVLCKTKKSFCAHNYAGSWNKKKSRKTIKDLLPKSIIKMIYIIGQKTWARNKYSWFQIPFDR